MFKVVKGNKAQELYSEVQVDAFVASGWEIVNEEGLAAPEEPAKPDEEDELTKLKIDADALGLIYHPLIGVAKLREKLEAAIGNLKV